MLGNVAKLFVGPLVMLAVFAIDGHINDIEANDFRLVITLDASENDFDRTLHSIVEGAPIKVIDAAGGIIETDERGYLLLASDARVRQVVMLDAALSTGVSAFRTPTEMIEYTIRLNSEMPGSSVRYADALRVSGRVRSARIERQQRFADNARAPSKPGRGRLLVRAVNAAGEVLSSATINDPRIIRYEQARSNGQLFGYREVFATTTLFNVSLPFDARITRLEIMALGADGQMSQKLAEIAAHP